MVYHTRGVDIEPAVCVNRLTKSGKRSGRLEAVMKTMTYYVPAVGVSYQREIGEAVFRIYIGYVGYDHPAVAQRCILWCRIQQVLIQTVCLACGRSSRTEAFLPEHQSVRTQDVIKTVAAYVELVPEVEPAQFVKLAAAALRKITGLAYMLAVHHYAAAQYVKLTGRAGVFVIPLTRYAKQPTECAYRIPGGTL